MHDKEQLELIEIFDSHLERFVEENEVIVFDDIESKENHIDIYWIKPNLEYRPYSILVTCGMSRNPMNVPKGYEDKKLIEVAMLFPLEWDFSDIKTKPDQITWPIYHLKSIGKMAKVQNTWIGFGHTIGCDETKGNYFPGTEFNSTIIFPSIVLPESFTKIDKQGKLIRIYSAIPLYPEELNYKLNNDSNALIEKFNEFRIQEIVDLNRKNTCK